MQSGNPFKKFIPITALLVMAMSGGVTIAQPVMPEKVEVAMRAQVNINQADASTIAATLVGVGESRAQAIVEYREKNGPFTSLEELEEVKGIGSSTIKMNKEKISLK